jgi:hypothetical protein
MACVQRPVARTVEIWQKLGQAVAPARDIDDAMRCADDICSVLGWTKVSAVIQRAADSFNDKATNPRGRAFAATMKARTRYLPLIHNPWVPIWGNGPLADVYRGELTPVFWVFADSWAPSSREMHHRATHREPVTEPVPWRSRAPARAQIPPALTQLVRPQCLDQTLGGLGRSDGVQHGPGRDRPGDQ